MFSGALPLPSRENFDPGQSRRSISLPAPGTSTEEPRKQTSPGAGMPVRRGKPDQRAQPENLVGKLRLLPCCTAT